MSFHSTVTQILKVKDIRTHVSITQLNGKIKETDIRTCDSEETLKSHMKILVLRSLFLMANFVIVTMRLLSTPLAEDAQVCPFCARDIKGA